MSYQRAINQPDAISQPACVFLRSKAMYVTGELDPNHVDEAGSHYCWCNLTQHILGPDDNPVERRACISGRDCYRETR